MSEHPPAEKARSQGPDDPLVQAQIERYRKEARKFDEEVRSLRLQRVEFRQRMSTPWYRKDRFIQITVAGILGIPLLLTLHDRILKPFYEMENIKLGLQNQRQARELDLRQLKLDSMKAANDSANRMLTRAWEVIGEREEMLDSIKPVLASALASTPRQAGTADPSLAASNRREAIEQLQRLRGTDAVAEYRPGQLAIQNHRLTGPNVSHEATENVGAPFGQGLPDALIFHFTSAPSLTEGVRALQNPALKAGSHVVIGRDGRVVQLAPFNITAFHAGLSSYGGRSGYNRYAIGVHLDNAGHLSKRGNKFVAWFGQAYPDSEVMAATHRDESAGGYWHRYTPVQLSVAREIATLLRREYGIREVLGHEDVARGRKLDPGPAFPLEEIRKQVMAGGS